MKIISLFSILFFPILIDAGCTLTQLQTLTEGRNLIINEISSMKEYYLSCAENHSFRKGRLSSMQVLCNYNNQWVLSFFLYSSQGRNYEHTGSVVLSEKDANDDLDDFTCIVNNFQTCQLPDFTTNRLITYQISRIPYRTSINLQCINSDEYFIELLCDAKGIIKKIKNDGKFEPENEAFTKQKLQQTCRKSCETPSEDKDGNRFSYSDDKTKTEFYERDVLVLDDQKVIMCIEKEWQYPEQKCNRSMIDSSIQLSREEYFDKEEIAITCPTNMHFNDQNTSDTLKLICKPTGWHEKITNAPIVDKLECAFCNEEKLFLLTKPKHLVVEFSGNDRNIYHLKCKEDYAFDGANVDLIAMCSNGEWTIDWKGGTEKSCNRENCDSVELKGEVPLKREVKMTLQVGSKKCHFL